MKKFNIRLAVLVVFLWALAYCAFGQTTYYGPYDPGAARKDLSNVPSTATLSIASATIPALEGVTSINGVTPLTAAQTASATNLGSMAAQNADSVAITGGVASLTSITLTDRVDAVNASISENLDVAGNVGAAKVSATAYDTEDGDLLDMMAMINGYNPKRWGIKIEKAESDPDARVTYLYDAVGMTPAAMNYTTGVFDYGDWKPFCDAMNRPVMLNPDGTVAYELDRSDQTKKLDGTASGISSTTHSLNAMSEFKRLWLRTYEDESYHYIIFSNVQYDPDYRADAFTAADGTIRDRMYYAMYEGSYVAPRLRSLATGTVMASQTGQTEIARAEANGAGWHINYKSQRDLITYLLWLISKSTYDMQKFGNGNSNSDADIAPGALKSTGQFWGDDATDAAVKTFFIENFWGNYWKRMSGLVLALDGEVRTKLTPPYTQPATPDENIMPAGYANTGIVPSGTSGTYLKDATVSPTAGFLPEANGGAENTYYTCGLWYTAGTTIKWALVGGPRGNAGLCGAGTVSLSYPLSYPSSYIGAALSFLKPAS